MSVLGAAEQIRESDLRQPEWKPQTGNKEFVFLCLYEQICLIIYINCMCVCVFQLQAVCESWEDCVWAHFRVMVDSLVEKELMSSGMAHQEVETLPREYLEAKYDTEIYRSS